MDKKEWHEFSNILKRILGLELDPVAINCSKVKAPDSDKSKVRICQAILSAAKGLPQIIDKKNNACLGAAWHLGFIKIRDKKATDMIKKFVVEGEKLFSSYQALDTLISQMEEVPDNSEASFILSPLEKSDYKPDIVIFICNPEQACRILTMITFIDGRMPKIKIGGPTCRMAIMYPLLTNEVNISFYDYTARKICNIDKDKLLISIPYAMLPKIIENLDHCTAGRAKMEYPQGFREFVQKKLSKAT